jgi:UDP-N-acetylglucosamine 1-carboxyvinyltransferase
MDKFVIRGGNPLLGTIKVSGAKNSALPCMAAAILTQDEVILENIPQVQDIETERKLLTSMGAEVELGYGRAQHRTSIKCAVLSDPVAKYEIVKTMRASSLVLGPLVARTGIARVAMPGGCAIGGRPIDLHIKGLESMGATITQEHGYLEARSPNNGSGQLKAAHIVFDKITVTGTEDLLMAASLADGESIFENCAREPEVTDLAALLNAMGAKIEGAGTTTIKIKGVAKLHGARHRINPDRIEAGTFLIAGAITGGDLNIDSSNPAHRGHLQARSLRRQARDRQGKRPRPLHRQQARWHRHHDRRIPRLPHRHAGPVHGPPHPGRRHLRSHRKHLRKPLHARQRT